MTSAVVFDLDGTLVDSTPDIAAAVNHTLVRRRLDPLPEQTVHEFTGYGADELVRRSFAAAGVPLAGDELEAETERYLARYGEHPADRSVLLEDAGEALRELAALGLAIGVCTNKETELTWTVLRALGVDDCVDAVVGIDSAPRRKPAPEHLLAALEPLGSERDEALYVGDTEIDVRTAEAAGVRCVMVAWGNGRDAQPVWARIERFAELPRLLRHGALDPAKR